MNMNETLFYKQGNKGTVDCFLCNHFCHIKNGHQGLCAVRLNKNGILHSVNYGKVVAACVDPVEKKPLFHFYPGSVTYSIACIGCNFRCGFCQNWQISQAKEALRLGLAGVQTPAEHIVLQAVSEGCKSVSYTYTEPTVYFEFACECSKLAKEKGLYNIFVTNGYMNKEVLPAISSYLDAANVDLKSFRENFYRNVCGASLKPVLENIELMKKLGIWVELTTLVIPGYNDSEDEFKDIVSFIASVDENMPWHISCFHPDYKFANVSFTDVSVLRKAYDIGKMKGLKFVYMGNVRAEDGENTFCPACGQVLIKRQGFLVGSIRIKEGMCEYCGVKIEGRF